MPKTLATAPVTFPKANELVDKWHRHHKKLPPGFAWFCIIAHTQDKIVGVAIAGRPTNRNNDDKLTVEVLRLATDGTRNACSCLLGACARAAKALGARRIITYTLVNESGSSLKGSGWICTKENTGKSWWTHNGSRVGAIDRPHMSTPKRRWELHFVRPFDLPGGPE